LRGLAKVLKSLIPVTGSLISQPLLICLAGLAGVWLGLGRRRGSLLASDLAGSGRSPSSGSLARCRMWRGQNGQHGQKQRSGGMESGPNHGNYCSWPVSQGVQIP
jgi:hypothetical protein